MKRVDIYITEEQFLKLEDLRNHGVSKSFFIRKAIDKHFDSFENGLPKETEGKKCK